MNKTYLIFRHEFVQNVKRAGYLVMTLIVPVLALAGIGLFRLAMNMTGAAAQVAPTTPLSPEVAGPVNLIVPGLFALLLALALMMGATALVRGLAEEKESRLIEVLFSSVSVRQLLTGKVLALGAAGLLQVLLWLISTPLILDLAAASFGGLLGQIHVPANFLALGIVYFILGYLLFAVLSIGLGAISSNPTQSGQLTLIYTLTSFIPLWFVALFMFYPESPLWIVLSIFPVTAPIQIMLRLGMSSIPAWQILTSVGVLVLSIVVGMVVSIRVFRVQMLMAGNRLSLSEIFRRDRTDRPRGDISLEAGSGQ